jgi:hypothetical protein
MENLKNRLKEGFVITLTNESFQERIGDDDVRFAEIRQRQNHSWANGFIIEFNGKNIHHSKTFNSFEKRLNKLIEKWNLEEVESELLEL